MKNLIYFTTLFCAVVFAFSCKPCPDCPEFVPEVSENAYTLTLKDTIHPSKFNTWRQNWVNHGQAYTNDTLTRYFTMPLVDLSEFDSLRSSEVVASRFHLGLQMVGNSRTPHLMLVGVNSSGNDVIDLSKEQYIYDVTQPCPNSCGVSSLSK